MSEYDNGPTSDDMNDRRYRSRADYADDPFKAMARHYDTRVVDKGGTSIFGPHRRPIVTAAGWNKSGNPSPKPPSRS